MWSDLWAPFHAQKTAVWGGGQVVLLPNAGGHDQRKKADGRWILAAGV